MKDIDSVSGADGNTSYIIGDDINQVVSILDDAAVNLFKWFSDNQMKPNPEKRHLLINKDC